MKNSTFHKLNLGFPLATANRSMFFFNYICNYINSRLANERLRQQTCFLFGLNFSGTFFEGVGRAGRHSFVWISSSGLCCISHEPARPLTCISLQAAKIVVTRRSAPGIAAEHARRGRWQRGRTRRWSTSESDSQGGQRHRQRDANRMHFRAGTFARPRTMGCKLVLIDCLAGWPFWLFSCDSI